MTIFYIKKKKKKKKKEGGALGQEGGALEQQGAPPAGCFSSLWETLQINIL